MCERERDSWAERAAALEVAQAPEVVAEPGEPEAAPSEKKGSAWRSEGVA